MTRAAGLVRASVVATLALCAWLHARGISALMGERIGVPGVAYAMQPPPAVVPPAERSADVILARNPFDSTTGSLLPDPGGPVSPSQPASGGLSGCSDVHVLAIAADEDPARSLALLRIDSEREPQLRGVAGDVVTIDPMGVLLERSGVRCVAWIFSRAAPVAAAPTPAPHTGIAATGASSFAVDRATRDALLDGAGDWMKTVTIRPEKVGDDMVGIRVVALKPGSPLEALGLRAGDVLQSVNGFPLTTPDKLLEALARLRTADHLSLAVQRGGHGLQVDYDVR
jgi:general secretion pathway protein C